MKRLSTIALLVVLLAACGKDADTPQAPPATPEPTLGELVIQNCYLLRDALEEAALVNNGRYPTRDWQVLLDGSTLEDHFPNGEMLVNPFTGIRSEPIPTQPSDSGSTGWITMDGGTGYLIEGVGTGHDVICRIFGGTAEEW